MNSAKVTIEYCTLCRWLLRASWLSQELLSTFADELEEVALRPGAKGIFRIWLGQEVIWDRQVEQRFPDAKELKQRIRDRIAPERSLGHSDH